jgi:hypothetical protein
MERMLGSSGTYRKGAVRRYFGPTVFALTIAIALLLPGHLLAMTVSTAKVTFNKKGDGFTLKANLLGLSTSGATDVTLEVGSFLQAIPIGLFKSTKQGLVFKAAKGATGITNLSLNPKNGALSATAKGISLATLADPGTMRLTAGTTNECEMLEFTEKPAAWNFGKHNTHFDCEIADLPIVNPTGVLTNTPTQVRVQARLSKNAALDPNSVELFGVDANLKPTGAPLCELTDDGNPG